MADLLLTSVEFGGYISILKFGLFLVLFYSWIPLLSWVYQDSESVGIESDVWPLVILGIGVVGAIVWLFIPLYIIGLLLYVIAIGAVAISYVMQRNALVSEFEKVLTASHIKGLFTNQEKKLAELRDIGFISAHGNEIPIPEFRTADFYSHKNAHDFFKGAIYQATNDIILSPQQQNYSLSYIVDGAKLDQNPLTHEQVERLSHFLKQLASLDVEERRKPQKGTFRIREGINVSQWEIETAGSTVGEHIKLHRIVQEAIPKLAEINLMPEQFEQLNGIKTSGRGLFLISGPKQSGVTTTLYALLRNHDAFTNNIYTLEYKPSGQLPNITQEVFSLSDSGTTTYGQKLISVARMGPEVIGVVDVKDTETSRAACIAAREGALVYAVLESDSAVNAFTKWLKLVGDRNLMLGTLLGISNQRLYRKLCDQCKQAYEPNKELLRKFNIAPDKVKVLYRAGKVVYDKRGKASPCEICHEIGFHKRTCSFEMIILNDQIRKALAQVKSSQEISTLFRSAKMRYLQEYLLDRVLDGTTSINEMIRVLSGPKQPGQTVQEE